MVSKNMCATKREQWAHAHDSTFHARRSWRVSGPVGRCHPAPWSHQALLQRAYWHHAWDILHDGPPTASKGVVVLDLLPVVQ